MMHGLKLHVKLCVRTLCCCGWKLSGCLSNSGSSVMAADSQLDIFPHLQVQQPVCTLLPQVYVGACKLLYMN
jgi:hypothetical protein